jgi:hypothetical protein
MDGWVDGWMEVKAVLRIAYSIQQSKIKNQFHICDIVNLKSGQNKAFKWLHKLDLFSTLYYYI